MKRQLDTICPSIEYGLPSIVPVDLQVVKKSPCRFSVSNEKLAYFYNESASVAKRKDNIHKQHLYTVQYVPLMENQNGNFHRLY